MSEVLVTGCCTSHTGALVCLFQDEENKSLIPFAISFPKYSAKSNIKSAIICLCRYEKPLLLVYRKPGEKAKIWHENSILYTNIARWQL